MFVSDILAQKGTSVHSVAPTASVAEVSQQLSARRIGSVLVIDAHGAVQGIVSERDVVRRAVAMGHDPSATTVDEIMTREIVHAGPDESYQNAVRLMDSANIRHLPVVEDGVLLSMISIRDLLRVELHASREEIRYLQEYIFHQPAEMARA